LSLLIKLLTLSIVSSIKVLPLTNFKYCFGVSSVESGLSLVPLPLARINATKIISPPVIYINYSINTMLIELNI